MKCRRHRKSLKKSACYVIKMRDYPFLFQGFSFPLLLSLSLIFMTSEFFFNDFLHLRSDLTELIFTIFKIKSLHRVEIIKHVPPLLFYLNCNITIACVVFPTLSRYTVKIVITITNHLKLKKCL